MEPTRRRTLLALGAAAGTGFLAGCTGGNGDGEDDENSTDENMSDSDTEQPDDGDDELESTVGQSENLTDIAGDGIEYASIVQVETSTNTEHYDWYPMEGSVEQFTDRPSGIHFEDRELPGEFDDWADDHAWATGEEHVYVYMIQSYGTTNCHNSISVSELGIEDGVYRLSTEVESTVHPSECDSETTFNTAVILIDFDEEMYDDIEESYIRIHNSDSSYMQFELEEPRGPIAELTRG